MEIYEIATGYTSVPAKVGAATEIVVEELTKAFIDNSVNAKIIDMADKNRKETDLPIIEVNIPSFLISADTSLGIIHKVKRVVYSVLLAGKLKKIIKNADEKIVLHFHNQYNLFFFLKLTSKKLRSKCFIAYTNHSGIWSLDLEDITDVLKRRYFQEAYALRKADRVFFLNEKMLDNAVKYLSISPERFTTIANGVNTDIFHPLSDEEIQNAKKNFGFENKNVFLQIGSIYENKNHKKSLRILSDYLKAHPESIYAYAGGIVSEEYQSQILRTANELGIESQVKYLGMLKPGEELNALYNSCCANILVSDYEGFPLVIVESLSAGTPVLLEINSPFSLGDGCVALNKDNFEITADYLLNNRELRSAARKNAEKSYSWNAVAINYIEEIQANIN